MRAPPGRDRPPPSREPPPPGLSPQADQLALFEAVRRWFLAVRPVFVLDDIQWAEPLFLDLLEHLAQWAKAAPVFVIGLARPEIRDLRPPLAERGREVDVDVDYLMFDIVNEWVVGYRLDFAEPDRTLPYIGVVTPDDQ